MSVKKYNFLRRYSEFSSIANAIILGYSGVHHLGSVERFSVAVGLYEILPSSVVVLGAFTVVTLMLYTSVSFCVFGSRTSVAFSVATWGLLCIAVGSAYARGIDVNCGCAMSDGNLGLLSVVKVVLLFLFAITGLLANVIPANGTETTTITNAPMNRTTL